MKISKDNLFKSIKSALMLDEEVTLKTNVDNTEEWDSLGHLSILSALDKNLNGKSSNIKELGEVKSVKEIADILKSHNLLDD